MENFTPLPYGGATRRPAIEYIDDSKQDDKIRLVPFISSTSDAYLLEMGDEYIRVYKDGAQLQFAGEAYEIGSPYAVADLPDVKFAQSVDVMWFTHPDYPVQRLSRLGDTDWTLLDEDFDYPPLLEENTEDIVISPDALTGTVTLTSSVDFFDAGHVGGYFKFDAIRNTENKNLEVNMSTTDKLTTESVYVSGSNWELSVSAGAPGIFTLQRSFDAGVTWEDYLNIGDSTLSSGSTKVFTLSSEEPEPLGARLRVVCVGGTSAANIINIDVDRIEWETLVKITEYISATQVTGEIIGEFQDLPNTTDYPVWTDLASYVTLGEGVQVNAGITYSTTSYTPAINNATGIDYGNSKFWIVNDDLATVRNLYEVQTNLSTIDNTYDISAQFTVVTDVAWYMDNLYICGTESTNVQVVKKFTEAGAYVSTVLSIETSDTFESLGFSNGSFWLGRHSGATERIYQYRSDWVYAGSSFVQDNNDITGTDEKLYILDSSANTIEVYTYGFSSESSKDISSETTTGVGIAYDGTDLFVLEASGNVYKYNFEESTRYYQLVKSGTGAGPTFSAQYANGHWAERTPAMSTWTEGAFSDYRGHPKTVTLFENRLTYAGTATEPNTIWMSRIDDYPDFLTGELDTDGMKLTMNSGKIDEIRWMVPQERLVIGTAGSEWSLGASDERKAISPTGFDLKRKTSYGSNDVQAILVNSAVVFLMRQSRKVREWTPNYNIQDYVAPDLSILAEHITEGGITQWDYQQQPDNVLWCIRADGTLIGFTYERDQNVTGWHRHVNDEFTFESVAVLPRDNEEDEVWVSVNMGGTRMIGRLNDREWGTNYLTEWQGSDLYKTYTSPGSATLTGLEHLNGKNVVVVGDGVVEATEKAVSGGSVTVDSAGYTTVTVGLAFTSTLAPLYLNIENQYGTSKGGKISNRTAQLHFKDTFSAKCGQTVADVEDVKFDSDDTALYNEVAPTWFDNASDWLLTTYVVQEDPMPCTILAMITDVEVD